MPRVKHALFFLTLTATAAISAWSVHSSPARGDEPPPPAPRLVLESISDLRAQGPVGLAKALAQYDALPAGPWREQAALRVDQVAGQRYATHSRLFWYTDIEEAKRVARASGKAILSLRLLGRLDEDFSCANSRMFRTVLYAAPKVSSYLRKHFVLHWSSEREVPKITIDFGGGRVMRSTIAGNSAHYLLDDEGRPIDVVPGLYSPSAFVAALEPGRKLAAQLATSRDRASLLRSYHQDQVRLSSERYFKLPVEQREALAAYRYTPIGRELLQAELLTMSKAYIEAPVAIELAIKTATLRDPQAIYATLGEVESLSPESRELIASIGPTDWAATPAQLTESALDAVLFGLAKRVAVDTLINELGLHPMIHEVFVQEPLQDFTALNAHIYADLFITPQDDPWLGMAQPEGFTGLPGDGLALLD